MQKYLPVLRNCPFFTGLTDDEILSILHCVSAAKITRPRGSYIFRAGDSTEVMGLMLSGSTLVIQEWLGHSDINTTSNIYTHLDFSSKVSSANAIVRIFPEETKV